MKLSEAILLGSAITDPAPYDIDHCALGMAANAAGIGKARDYVFVDVHNEQIKLRWPWRNEQIKLRWPWLLDRLAAFKTPDRWGNTITYTCDVPSWGNAIVHTYDERVYPGHITLEEFVDDIRKIEPECGECNRFVCSCASHATTVDDVARYAGTRG